MNANSGQSGEAPSGRRLHGAWAHLTLDRLVETAARARTQRRAFVDAPDRQVWDGSPAAMLTSGELSREVNLRARQLLSLGLTPGDAVVTVLPNTTDAVAMLLGLQLAGLVPCPLPVVASADEIRDAAEAARARAIIAVDLYAAHRPAASATRAAAQIFGVRFVCALGATSEPGVVSLSDWIPEASADDRLPAIEPHWPALASLRQTASGPRILLRNHAQLIADALALSAVAGLSGRNALLATLAPVSAVSFVAALVSPLISSCVALLHGPFEPDVFQDQLRRESDAVALLPEKAEAAVRHIAPAQLSGIISVVRDPSSPAPGEAGDRPRVTELISFDEAALLSLPRANGPGRRLPRFSAHPVSSALPRTEAHLGLFADEQGRLNLHGFALAMDGAQPASPSRTRWSARADGAAHLIATGEADEAMERPDIAAVA